MLPDDLKQLTLIPARTLRKGFQIIPPDPGVYFFFVRDGHRLLKATAYFETGEHPLITVGDYTHLYTGATMNLRFRLTQHFVSPREENSSPRKTFMALEEAFGVISKNTKRKLDRDALTDWMYRNIRVGYLIARKPFDRERQLLKRHSSPFNIAHRRMDEYPQRLMSWRAMAYPPSGK